MELVDMQNLKFCARKACGFDSRPAHQNDQHLAGHFFILLRMCVFRNHSLLDSAAVQAALVP
jgi:hypothetical protein